MYIYQGLVFNLLMPFRNSCLHTCRHAHDAANVFDLQKCQYNNKLGKKTPGVKQTSAKTK